MSEDAVFFTPKQWSRRFGRNFFTVRCVGHEVADPGAFVEFVLEMERGDGDVAESAQASGAHGPRQWTRKHRYNDFVQFRTDLDKRGLLCEEACEFPPKGWPWNRYDENFLLTRQGALEGWLFEQLKSKDVLGLEETHKFLGLV
mmetsp:Transcript_22719/g.44579  ORF Transcript_22719/g.44579 Transcript_22719/m.44579 type:complete len:144 (-) Transcript_22719:889-1320(-)|eukprot:CAMPEP_0171488704 /NCGR_PEP_ID=MMETSP0958-20121227/2348_1 /TAXON_ID=87120 /ORGANISM="Aurantiochytrium limacinum, Strain ATCCMYA-1381" /LENGTH=143 /DNA_ID=CAMNT_0012021833 /DNA_START=83 /DNA_END=514 /DNA_ORIENTATION=+